MTGGATPLILASASPRRTEILSTLGLPHRVEPARVDEAPRPGEDPAAHVERLAREKAAQVAGRHPGAWVVAGDTVVTVDGGVLGKPADPEDAVAMLLALQGRPHRVASGLAVAAPPGKERPGPVLLSGVEITEVRFRPFDEATARAYVATGEPMDKAGAYGIQGLGSALVMGISGDYSGVVGLPVSLLLALLERAGSPYRFPTPP